MTRLTACCPLVKRGRIAIVTIGGTMCRTGRANRASDRSWRSREACAAATPQRTCARRVDRSHARAALAAHTQRPRDRRQPPFGAARPRCPRLAGPRRTATCDHDRAGFAERSGRRWQRAPSRRAWHHGHWSRSAPVPRRACLNVPCRPSPPTCPAPATGLPLGPADAREPPCVPLAPGRADRRRNLLLRRHTER